jgi:aryl-alcohol dehydrogenase-like predicted oxidoreductase
MRRVILGGTGIETSALGFGCASLGSRAGAAAGRRALEEAHAAGVTWFDLAPVYGGGAAEAIAAPFLKANRDTVQVATKAGLALGAGAGGALRRRLMPLARGALALAGPKLTARLRRAAPAANAKPPLTPGLIAASLDASLRRLGLERVDLFALHAPDADEVGRDDVLAALEAVLAAGKARAVAVAGDAAAAAAALAVGAPYAAVQLAVPGPDDRAAAAVLAAAPAAGFGTLVHSVFGAGGTPPAAGRERLARAFALNPEGVVLVSMLSAESRAATLAAAALGADPPAAAAGRAR